MGDARNRLRKYPRLQNLMIGAGVLSCGQTLAKKHIDLATHASRGKTPAPVILGVSRGVQLCLFCSMPNIFDQSQRRKEIGHFQKF